MQNMTEDIEIAREDVERILARIEEKTRKNFFRIKTNQKEKTTLTGSKIGGIPYWKNLKNYPKTTQGEKLALLSQINFADLPQNDQFPKEGLLQFFFLPNDLYGMDYDYPDNQNTFRVVYHKEIDDSIEPLEGIPTSLLLNEYEDNMPHYGEIAIEFSMESETLTPYVYNFQNVFSCTAKELGISLPKNYSLYNVLENEDYEHYIKIAEGHKLLGYPFFTQFDPRNERNPEEEFYDTLLFQIDSEESKDAGFGIMWGDCGIANFFINHEDLKNRNFTRILYNWDCY